MPRSSLPWLILGAVVVSAALAWLTLTHGGYAGGAARPSERHLLAPFQEVEIGGVADVILIQGDLEALDVTTAGRAVVDAHVSRGRLGIRAHDRRRWWSRLLGHRAAEPPTITIHLRKLDQLGLSGNVNVSIPRLRTNTLRIVASGGATLAIDDLQATTLHVDGSGALKATLAGRVDDEHVSISGAGTYRAEGLRAGSATVSVSGVGKVAVHAERKLRADISGAGLIEYAGDPEVTEDISGIGRVKRLDSTAIPGVHLAAATRAAAAWAAAARP